MAVADATWAAASRTEVRRIEPRVGPLLIAAGLVAGLAIVLASTPITARGDYGQWLMASRYYLGEAVPGYRFIPALPPVVPLAMAGIQLAVHEPVMALQVTNVLMMVGLALSFFAAGTALARSAAAGLFSVAIGLLVTDRYLELFAFGGLLQSAAVMFTAFAVAAFVRAGWGPGVGLRWWIAGSVTLALAALSHVGAGTVAVPTGLAVAAISLFRLRDLGWPRLRRALVPVAIGLAAIAIYWLLVLLPASSDYVTNPASLGYRGPERLLSSLFEFWPTAMVIVVGFATVAIGTLSELLQRTLDRFASLAAWTGMAWGSLAFAVVTNASTDYPRFAPVLLAPLVVACGLAAWWLTRALGEYLSSVAPWSRPSAWIVLTATVAILVATPFAIQRYQGAASTYQPRDAAALTDAVEWVDANITATDVAVLTAVRDGKWLEGLTGREALFSLPVRYAFRPTEWQRSVDAEAVLRSTAALTNGYFFVKYTDEAGNGVRAVPVGMLLGINHGGEFVDLLRQAPRDTRLIGADGTATVADLDPVGVRLSQTDVDAFIRTEWSGLIAGEAVSLTRSVRVIDGGATLELTDTSSGPAVETTLYAPVGMAITELTITGGEARVCFNRIGAKSPCLRILAAAPDATIEAVSDGGLRIRTTGPQLPVFITALTAGAPSVGLGILDPAQVVEDHRIGAALLINTDPAYTFRRARLETLGFAVAHVAGPYSVLVRSDLESPP